MNYILNPNGRERLHTEEELEAFDRNVCATDPDGNEYC
jgi:hypothetical protein